MALLNNMIILGLIINYHNFLYINVQYLLQNIILNHIYYLVYSHESYIV